MNGEKMLRVAKLQSKSYSNHLPNQESAVVHSYTCNFNHHYEKPTLSLKYVISGIENYKIDGRTYSVAPQQFLLVNAEREYWGESYQKNQMEEGFCIYLNTSLLQEVSAVNNQPEGALLDNFGHLKTESLEFFEQIYSSDDNELGKLLKSTAAQICQDTQADLPNHWDFYFEVCEKLLFQQNKAVQQLNRLKTVKLSTKLELYRRLEIAKEYIDRHYTQKLDVEAIARTAAISEYHFFRSFKQVYGISPYQYLLKKRLQKAVELLSANRFSVTETAYMIGFSDIHAFSKSFKKEYKVSPLELLQDHRKSLVTMHS
jgi:AraC-like DNA-binding protein